MPFHRRDDRTSKFRKEEDDAVAKFLEGGGAITRVANSRKAKKLKRSPTATNAAEKMGIVMIDLD